ncbi:MAG: ECF-type sigma factor [Pirellulales bacterium]
MSDSDTQDILNRVRQGDSAAAFTLYNRYVGRLVGLVRRNLPRQFGRRIEAEDVAHAACRSFLIRFRDDQFDVQESGAAWRLLAAMAMNKLRQEKRFHMAERRTVASEESVAVDGSVFGVAVGKLVSEPLPDEVAALREVLEGLMASLASAKRRIVELHLQGCSVAKIASDLNCSERNVQRSLQEFRRLLENQLVGCEPFVAPQQTLGFKRAVSGPAGSE